MLLVAAALSPPVAVRRDQRPTMGIPSRILPAMRAIFPTSLRKSPPRQTWSEPRTHRQVEAPSQLAGLARNEAAGLLYARIAFDSETASVEK